MTRTRVLMQALFLLICTLTAAVGGAQSITFESVAPGTLIRDQFQAQGVRISGAGSFSGLVYAEGEFGTANYGNSPTHIVDVGLRSQPTTIRFVDPAHPDVTLGATAVSLRLGDGDPDAETFTVTYYDVSGSILLGPVTYTTNASGLPLSQTSASLGGVIGSVKLELLPSSVSGVTFDDLAFTLSPSPGTCTYSFNSGSGDAQVSYCVSATGTMPKLLAPAGREHINVGDVWEGFVVCTGTTAQAWDLSADALGFGAPSLLQNPSATGVSLRQSSAQFQLDQAFKLDKVEKDVTITMTLTNISGAQLTDVRLARVFDPDADNDFGDDFESRTARGVMAVDVDAVTLTGTTWTVPTDTAIDTAPTAACSPASAVGPTLTGDASLANVTYRLGTMKAGVKKKVVFVYRVQ